MGEMITKPDANPVILAIANLFFAAPGYFLMGQKKKAMISLVIFVVTTCVGLSWVWMLIAAYDAYLLGQKLAAGESIGEVENGLEFLNMIFK